MLQGLRSALEYLGGERDGVPPALAAFPPWVVRTVTWVIFLAVIYAFSGQASKFIYIDF